MITRDNFLIDLKKLVFSTFNLYHAIEPKNEIGVLQYYK